MYSFVISEVGPPGAGKTTALQEFCKGENVCLISEEKRNPTDEEKKAWGFDEPISTSWYPNFGTIVVRFNYVKQKFRIDQGIGTVGEGDYLINMVDTCGQKAYFHYSDDQLQHTQGILFFFDATRDPEEYKMEIINIFNEVKQLYQGQLFPPVVFVANKQDLVLQRRIYGGGYGRELLYQRILGSRDPFFNKVPFVGASALEGWGLDKAMDLLMREIVKRVNSILYKTLVPKEEGKWAGIY